VAVVVRVGLVALFVAGVADREEVTTLSAALVVGVAGVARVAGVSGFSDAASVASGSALGARTSDTFCDLAAVCEGRAVVGDRRAACAWRAVVDFFGISFTPV
jgi:hypothetical protein